MTAEELKYKYTEASWLIAKRSASAAGKALLFNTEILQDTTLEIAVIYGLSDEEIYRLQPKNNDGAIVSAQRMAKGLLGNGADANAGQAIKIARTAIQNGQNAKMLATLLKAGPKAAQTAAAGGHVASKGTPWGWIATAGYAAGTAGWFAYKARAFNLEAFELVREREGIASIAEPKDVNEQSPGETITLQVKLPTAAAITRRASMLTGKAGAAFTNAFGRVRGLRS